MAALAPCFAEIFIVPTLFGLHNTNISVSGFIIVVRSLVCVSSSSRIIHRISKFKRNCICNMYHLLYITHSKENLIFTIFCLRPCALPLPNYTFHNIVYTTL